MKKFILNNLVWYRNLLESLLWCLMSYGMMTKSTYYRACCFDLSVIVELLCLKIIHVLRKLACDFYLIECYVIRYHTSIFLFVFVLAAKCLKTCLWNSATVKIVLSELMTSQLTYVNNYFSDELQCFLLFDLIFWFDFLIFG